MRLIPAKRTVKENPMDKERAILNPPSFLSGPLLRVQDLHVSFESSDPGSEGGKLMNLERRDVVQGVSFSLHRGETLALVGESGSGKSVTALSILKLLPYPTASHPKGSIFFEGVDLLKENEGYLRQVRGRKIGMIFQEPMTSLNPLHTIEKQIGEMFLIHHGLRLPQARDRIVDLLQKVGFEEGAQRLTAYPHQLSGGQRQRVMIAMALAGDPNMLIADEPTTALDVTLQAQILSLLKDLQKKRKLALLLITHDLSLVQTMADTVVVLKDGNALETGPAKTVFKMPRHSYTKNLLEAEPEGKPHPFDTQAPTLLKVENLTVAFPIRTGFFQRTTRSIAAVQGVHFDLKPGETLGVVGESGSGKTTLAMAILRLEKSIGTIQFQGRPIETLPHRALRPIRREMQIVFQDPFGSLSPRMTIGEIVGEGLEVHQNGLSKTAYDHLLIEVLAQVGLAPETRHRYPHEFSGGQRQRIAIARAMVLKPRLVILDEPTSALDRVIQKDILHLLKSFQIAHKIAYIFISHDLRVVRAISHKVIVLYRGQIVEHGSVDQIFQAPQHPYTQALQKSAFPFGSSLEDTFR